MCYWPGFSPTRRPGSTAERRAPAPGCRRGQCLPSAIVVLALIAIGLPIARAADLPPAVSQALQEAGIAARSVAIVVQAVDGGPPLLSHNPRQAMNPASAMKLVTTYAGLDPARAGVYLAHRSARRRRPGQRPRSTAICICAAAATRGLVSNSSGCCCGSCARAGWPKSAATCCFIAALSRCHRTIRRSSSNEPLRPIQRRPGRAAGEPQERSPDAAAGPGTPGGEGDRRNAERELAHQQSPAPRARRLRRLARTNQAGGLAARPSNSAAVFRRPAARRRYTSRRGPPTSRLTVCSVPCGANSVAVSTAASAKAACRPARARWQSRSHRRSARSFAISTSTATTYGAPVVSDTSRQRAAGDGGGRSPSDHRLAAGEGAEAARTGAR